MELAILIGVIYLSKTILEKKGLSIPYPKVIIVLLIFSLATLLLISFGVFSLSNGKLSDENGFFFIPLLIAILIGYSLFIYKKSNQIPSPKSHKQKINFKTIIFLIPLVTLLAVAKYSFLLPMYSPQSLNLESQSPHIATIAYSSFVTLLAIVYWSIGKFTAVKYEISLILIFFSYNLYLTTIYCLVLLYGFISKFEISYPFYGSIFCLSFLPTLAILIGLLFENTDKKQLLKD